jgi:hypothetical protein
MTIVEHLTELERALLSSILAGDHPALAVLRDQLAGAGVTEREFSGVGFFTHFAVSPAAPRLPVRRWVISDVDLNLDGLQHPAGALLFVENGVLSMLEAYAYASEDWPTEPESFSVYYTTRGRAVGSGFQIEHTDSRDLAWLAEEYEAAESRSAPG